MATIVISVIGCICTVGGFFITVGTVMRKSVSKDDIANLASKDDLKDIKVKLDMLTEKSANHSERIAVLEYQVRELQTK